MIKYQVVILLSVRMKSQAIVRHGRISKEGFRESMTMCSSGVEPKNEGHDLFEVDNA